MAERIMLRLGDFDFEIATAAYQKYIAHHSAKWAEQERIGRDPALQFVGMGTVEITLDGVVYPALAGSRSASPVGRVDFADSGIKRGGNAGIDTFDDLFALAEEIPDEFSVPQARAVARLAGEVARATAANAQAAADAFSGLSSPHRHMPQGVFGAANRLRSVVQTIVDLSGATGEALTALVSLALAVEKESDMLPIVAALCSGIRHVHDTANLTRCGVDADVQLLEHTAETFLAVAGISNGPTETERRAVAETCRSAAEHGRTLVRSCEATCRCAEILLDKLSEVARP